MLIVYPMRALSYNTLAVRFERSGSGGGLQDAEAAQREENAGGEGERADGNVRDGERNVNGSGLHSVARGEDGPIGRSSQQNLDAESDFEVARRSAQIFHAAEACGNRENGPEHHEGDNDSADQMRNDAEGVVAERSAKDDLDEDERGRPYGERAQARRVMILELWKFALPPFSCENGERKNGDEKKFGEGGVRGGDWRRQQKLHSNGAEQSLRDDESNGGPREIADPATRFLKLRPDGENQREN